MRQLFLGFLLLINGCKLWAQSPPPHPLCDMTGPLNNNVLTFNNKKIVFNEHGGSDGYVYLNQNVIIPTYLAANGVYDSNGEVIFVVTYEASEMGINFATLVAFNKFGEKFYLYKRSFTSSTSEPEPPLAQQINVGSVSNELVLFQVPGSCDEFYVIHGSETVLIGVSGMWSVLTRLKFISTNHSLVTVSSAGFANKVGNVVHLVSGLLRDNSPLFEGVANPNFDKLYRNIYSFGRQPSLGDLSYLRDRFISMARVYEGQLYSLDQPLMEQFPLVGFGPPGQAGELGEVVVIKENQCSTGANNKYCPPFEIDDALMLSQNSSSTKILIVGKKGKLNHAVKVPFGPSSPIWYFEETYLNGTSYFNLKSYTTDINRISGIAAYDPYPNDGVIPYFFFSQESNNSKNIQVRKDFLVSKFYDPPTSELLIYTFPTRGGHIPSSENSGHKSALEISFNEKYLVFASVPQSGNPGIGLLDIQSISDEDLSLHTSYLIPNISSYQQTSYGNGNYATNTQLHRQKYTGPENGMMPTCTSTISFSDQTTSSGIGTQANAGQWIKAQGNSTIEATKTSSFFAGEYIQLKPNFHAEVNSNFRAAIQGCPYTQNCCQAAVRVDASMVFSSGRLAVGDRQGTQPALTLIPNPAHDAVTLQVEHGQKVEGVELRDAMNRLMCTWGKPQSNTVVLMGIPAGVYALSANVNGYVFTQKLVVE